MNFSGYMATILYSVVSHGYLWMLRGQIQTNLPPGHPIMSSKTIEFKAVKRSITHDKQGVKGNKETKEHY